MLFALAVLLLQAAEAPAAVGSPQSVVDNSSVQIQAFSTTRTRLSVVSPDREPSSENGPRELAKELAPFSASLEAWRRLRLLSLSHIAEKDPATSAPTVKGLVQAQAASKRDALSAPQTNALLGGTPQGGASPFRVKTETGETKQLWYALLVMQHSAATFDAWSSRRVIQNGSGYEGNPLLRPFAHSSAFYPVIHVGPILFDYLGYRMTKSPNRVLRRFWWIPQLAGTVVHLWSGAHNLSVARRLRPGSIP